MRPYFILALVWLLAALYFFSRPLYQPDEARYTILDSDWSIGWILLLMACWNGVRWFLTRHKASRESTTEHPPKSPT
jgi:hypothetical protein